MALLDHSQRLHFESRLDTMSLSVSRASPGDWVKVGVLGERFWCLVKTVREDGMLVASVDNDLVACPLKVGDEVTLRRENVLEVASSTDRSQFEHMALGTGPRVEAAHRSVEAAQLWHYWRSSKGVGVTPRPNTQYMVGENIIL